MASAPLPAQRAVIRSPEEPLLLFTFIVLLNTPINVSLVRQFTDSIILKIRILTTLHNEKGDNQEIF